MTISTISGITPLSTTTKVAGQRKLSSDDEPLFPSKTTTVSTSTTSATSKTVSTSETTSDGTPSEKTQIKNQNMKNLKTAYDNILDNLDNLDLPEGIDKETFKEKLSGGYQYHIVNQDLPETLATPADFASDLMLNALNGCGWADNQKNDMIKMAATLFPDDEIGGQKCSDLSSKPFSIEVNENGGQSLVLNEDIQAQNTENLESAYNTLLEKIDNLELPEGVSKAELRAKLPQIYEETLQDMPDSTSTPAEFAYSLLAEAFKDISGSEISLLKLTSNLYPDDEIGGIKCSDLSSKPFSIVEDENGGRSLKLLEE